MQSKWWSTGVRSYHPNFREVDLQGLDMDAFVQECVDTGANMVVPSAGGMLAMYPSKLPLQPVSKYLGGRDFLGEFTEKAHKARLKVVARVDFGQALQPAYEAHPDWFSVDKDGKPMAKKMPVYNIYRPCPNGPYRNEGYARYVIEEIKANYPVDGFHLNAGTFPGFCYCENCQRKFKAEFGVEIPRQADWDSELWKDFISWRYRCTAENLGYLLKVMREGKPDMFWMQELSAPMSGGSRNGAGDLIQLAKTCSLLLVVVGRAMDKDSFEYASGMSAKYCWNLGADGEPVMNLKLFVSSGAWNRSMIPLDEYRFWMYQAIANGNGLKLPIFSDSRQDDKRNFAALNEALNFLKDNEQHYTSMQPVTPVALVWGQNTLDMYGRDDADGRYISHFRGMYKALVAEHIPFTVIPDVALTADNLKKYKVIVLSNTACLSQAQADAVQEYVKNGGGLVSTFESGIYDERGRRFECFPLRDTLGIQHGAPALRQQPAAYMYRAVANHPLYDAIGDTTILTHSLRHCEVAPKGGAQVVMTLAHHIQPGPPELIDNFTVTETPLAVANALGSGRSLYFANEIDKLYHTVGFGEQHKIIGNAVRWAANGQMPIETSAPSMVEVSALQKDGELVVHYVNGTGNRPLDQVVTIPDVETRVQVPAGAKFGSARCLVSGQALDLTERDGWVEFTLPRLGGYEAIVLSA